MTIAKGTTDPTAECLWPMPKQQPCSNQTIPICRQTVKMLLSSCCQAVCSHWAFIDTFLNTNFNTSNDKTLDRNDCVLILIIKAHYIHLIFFRACDVCWQKVVPPKIAMRLMVMIMVSGAPLITALFLVQQMNMAVALMVPMVTSMWLPFAFSLANRQVSPDNVPVFHQLPHNRLCVRQILTVTPILRHISCEVTQSIQIRW